jgi:hypothetical protein
MPGVTAQANGKRGPKLQKPPSNIHENASQHFFNYNHILYTLHCMADDLPAKTLVIAAKHQPNNIKLSQLHAVIVFQQAFQSQNS